MTGTPAHHFAKLYTDRDGSQILVMHNESNDEGKPEVRAYCRPHEDLGVCSVASVWQDTDLGHAAARARFDRTDEAEARRMAAGVRAEVAKR